MTDEKDIEEVPEEGGTEDPVTAESAGLGGGTRDDVVLEAQVESLTHDDDEDDTDDEIDSAREQLKEDQEDLEDEDDEAAEGDESEGESSLFDRYVSKVVGRGGEKYANLRAQLTGQVVLSVTDVKEGFTFDWSTEKLQVEKWSGSAPEKYSCLVELSSKNFEQIVRGRLNPQVAMLSHKVNVQGEFSQAVYLFNLFSR